MCCVTLDLDQAGADLVSPAPPAGSADIIAGLLAPGLQDDLHQTVITENRGEAGGNAAQGPDADYGGASPVASTEAQTYSASARATRHSSARS